jgi:hypothetical protein
MGFTRFPQADFHKWRDGTLVRLRHDGLTDPGEGQHTNGAAINYLARLALVR